MADVFHFKNESVFQKHLTQSFEEAGALVRSTQSTPYQKSGWPDLYVVSRMWRGWLELKVDKREMEPLQCSRIREMRKRGDVGYFLQHRRGDRLYYLIGPDGEAEGQIDSKQNGAGVLRQLALFTRVLGLQPDM